MKKISSVVSLSVLVLLLLVTPVICSSDWVEYGESRDGISSYNKVSIKHLTKDIVQVWSKIDHSDEGRNKLIQLLSKTGSTPEGWDKLSHSLYFMEIECKKGMSRYLSKRFYGGDGGVLYSMDLDNSKWDYISPDSMGNTLRKEVCK